MLPMFVELDMYFVILESYPYIMISASGHSLGSRSLGQNTVVTPSRLLRVVEVSSGNELSSSGESVGCLEGRRSSLDISLFEAEGDPSGAAPGRAGPEYVHVFEGWPWSP